MMSPNIRQTTARQADELVERQQEIVERQIRRSTGAPKQQAIMPASWPEQERRDQNQRRRTATLTLFVQRAAHLPHGQAPPPWSRFDRDESAMLHFVAVSPQSPDRQVA
jgi:hypothetical protein